MATVPPGLTDTRLALHQVAVHVVARRRYAVTGRFGLRPSPGGIATPAFGDDAEVVRTSGRYLVVERGGGAADVEMTSLRRAAALARVDLPGDRADDFHVGADTPAMVDPDQPLSFDDTALEVLAAWYAFGLTAIDHVVATEPAVAAASARQLWPEHFDLGATIRLRRGDGDPGTDVQVNVGASPGDGLEPSPYLYVGPWDADRPGDLSYWNAPFGALLRYADLAGGPLGERRDRALGFFGRGLELLTRAPASG